MQQERTGFTGCCKSSFNSQSAENISPQCAAQLHRCALSPHVRPILTAKLHKTCFLALMSAQDFN